MRCLAFSLVLILALIGCASTQHEANPAETVLPLGYAWFDGRKTEYIVTDISDAGMAAMMGVNYVPRLADALGAPGRPSLTERVYKFPNNEQISIFQSAPNPTGAANEDRHYSPLWRVVMVTWRHPEKRQELRSEETLLAAEEAGDVELTVTDIVVNCPVTRSVDGQALKGVR